MQRNDVFVEAGELTHISLNEHLLAVTILGMLLRDPDDPLLGSLAVFLSRLILPGAEGRR